MATPPKKGKLLYHLTLTDNLESILQNGLLARDAIKEFVDVADHEIIAHREEKRLNSFVPFHFFGGNPFDGSVQLNHQDKKFVFITLKRTYARENGFKILPQHPLSLDDCTLLDYDDGMEQINWTKMSERNYSDQECKEICMAECLSNRKIDATDFHAIFVPDQRTKDLVIRLRNKVIGTKNSFYVDILNSIFVK